MLVILSGVETIHKKFLARKILAKLNTFIVDGYTVDFSFEPFRVTDANGKVVYSMAHGEQPMTNELLLDLDNDGVIDPEGTATFDKIVQMNDDLFLTGGKENHFTSVFVDIAHDLGLTDTIDYNIDVSDTVLLHPHSYNDVLENYKNRIGTTHVITGIFSKAFIDSIKLELGAENVTVINIIRNPSTCILLNPKDDEYYANPNKERTRESDDNKLFRSIINATILSKVDYVTTIKFEDMLETGKFTVNNVDIGLPEGYTPFNNWLTTWENNNIIPLNLISETDLNKLNATLQNWATQTSVSVDESALNTINKLRAIPLQSVTEMQVFILANFPENVFDILDYDLLDYEDIVS
jgi:hypothetical protein